jgi:hypothetical protein
LTLRSHLVFMHPGTVQNPTLRCGNTLVAPLLFGPLFAIYLYFGART